MAETPPGTTSEAVRIAALEARLESLHRQQEELIQRRDADIAARNAELERMNQVFNIQAEQHEKQIAVMMRGQQIQAAAYAEQATAPDIERSQR